MDRLVTKRKRRSSNETDGRPQAKRSEREVNGTSDIHSLRIKPERHGLCVNVEDQGSKFLFVSDSVVRLPPRDDEMLALYVQ